jgi:hypothetical protein
MNFEDKCMLMSTTAENLTNNRIALSYLFLFFTVDKELSKQNLLQDYAKVTYFYYLVKSIETEFCKCIIFIV